MVAKFLKIELCLLILGVLVGNGLSIIETRFASWNYIGRVPGVPKYLFYDGFLYGPVYVRTSNGETFSCDQAKQTCVISTEIRTFDRFFKPGSDDSLTPLPPGTVVASFMGYASYGDYVLTPHFIALDDGSIWTWTNMPSYAGLINSFVYFVMGTGLTILFLLVSSIYQSRSQQKVKNDFKRS